MSSSSMEASVLLRLRDDLTAPARHAAASVKSLVKDLEKLKSLSGGSNSANRQMQAIVREMKSAARAAESLRREMGRPMEDGFARAASGIERVRNEARQAARAVSELNGRLRRGGDFYGGVNANGGHGGGGRNHGGMGFGHAAGHITRHAAGNAVGLGFAAIGGEVAEGVSGAIRAGLDQAFDIQHQRAMMTLQRVGFDSKTGQDNTSAMIEQSVAQARAMAKTIPQFTVAQHLGAINELRPAMIGGLRETLEFAPQFQQAVGVLEAVKGQHGHQAMAGIDAHGEALDLARALELKGVMGDGPDAIKSYTNGMVKAIVAFNNQIGAGDFHAAIKMGRGAARGWSEDFVEHFMPTIMNDIKSKGGTATGAGNALASFSRAAVDGKMTKQAMAEWYSLGLINDGHAVWNKKHTGIDHLTPGAILNWQGAMANPYTWMQDTLLPALKKANNGKDPTQQEVMNRLGALFGNRVAQMLATIFAVQQKQIEKDAQNIRDAMGLDGLAKLYDMDSTTRMQVAAAAFKDLGGAIGELTLGGNMRSLKGVIDWAHQATEAIQKSAKWQAFGRHYDEFAAGFWHQQATPGADKKWVTDGAEIRDAVSNIKRSLLDLAAALAPAGDIHAGIKEFSDSVAAIRKAFEAEQRFENDPIGEIKKALDYNNNDTYGDIKKKQADAKAAAENAVQSDAAAKAKAVHDAAKPLLKLPPMLRQGGAQAHRMGFNYNPFGGLGGAKLSFGIPSAQSLIAPIASAAAAALPVFAQAGQRDVGALASGLQAGSGTATAAMSGLMGSLAAIAGGGITVPVKLDTSGAESQLSSLMAKSAGAKAGGNGRFSKSLSDIGQ